MGRSELILGVNWNPPHWNPPQLIYMEMTEEYRAHLIAYIEFRRKKWWQFWIKKPEPFTGIDYKESFRTTI